MTTVEQESLSKQLNKLKLVIGAADSATKKKTTASIVDKNLVTANFATDNTHAGSTERIASNKNMDIIRTIAMQNTQNLANATVMNDQLEEKKQKKRLETEKKALQDKIERQKRDLKKNKNKNSSSEEEAEDDNAEDDGSYGFSVLKPARSYDDNGASNSQFQKIPSGKKNINVKQMVKGTKPKSKIDDFHDDDDDSSDEEVIKDNKKTYLRHRDDDD